ncbi:MAG: hypothetical protein ABI838_08215 [Chloroflexota bacterium]
MRWMLLATVVLLAGCTAPGSAPSASPTHRSSLPPLSIASSSPTPSPGATPSPTPTAAPTPTPAPPPATGGPSPIATCHGSMAASHNYVLGTVAGDATVVVRDITDVASPTNVCTIAGNPAGIRFVNEGRIAYLDGSGRVISEGLGDAAGDVRVEATAVNGFGSRFAFSPDGRSITYIAGDNTWHLKTPAGDRVLATMPAVPGRGVNQDEDDYFLGYSPDGQYFGLVQTFRTGGTGETAADQVRRASDGGLVFSTSGMTMAVWSSQPSRLFYRDTAGTMKRWDASAGQSDMLALHWLRPSSSPDGRWIAYGFRSPGGDGVGFYGVQSNSVANTSPPGRFGGVFLNNNLVWYQGDRPCVEADNCGIGGPSIPTGRTYIYDLAGASETPSRLTSVFDVWPHLTAPPGFG